MVYLQHRDRRELAREVVKSQFIVRVQIERGNPGGGHVSQTAIGREGHVEIGFHAVPLHGTNTRYRLGHLAGADGEGQPITQLQTEFLRQLSFYRNPLGFARPEPLAIHNPVVFRQLRHPGQIQLPVQRTNPLILADRFFHRLAVQFGQATANHRIKRLQGRAASGPEFLNIIHRIRGNVDQEMVWRVVRQLGLPVVQQGGTHQHQRSSQHKRHGKNRHLRHAGTSVPI